MSVSLQTASWRLSRHESMTTEDTHNQKYLLGDTE